MRLVGERRDVQILDVAAGTGIVGVGVRLQGWISDLVEGGTMVEGGTILSGD